MMIAIANGENGNRVILLGVARGNIDRLTAGRPIRASAETHPGFPPDVTVGIIFGETEAELEKLIEPFLSAHTQVHGTPDAAPPPPFPIGATGEFPYGKQDDTDEGELATAIGVDPKNGVIRIEFGKLVSWLSLPAVEARRLAAVLTQKAEELEKRLS